MWTEPGLSSCRSRCLTYPFIPCVVLAIALSAAGQQSYRTQQSLRPQFNAAPQQSQAAARSIPPRALRFLGWRESAKEGPAVTRYFQGLEQRSRPTARIRPGFKPEASVSARSSFIATTLPTSSSSFPGIDLRPSLPAGAIPSGVVAGDFNGDGKADWVVVNAGDNTLDIYLGKGDGTSQLPVIIPLLGQSPVGIAAGDLNGDGKLDLAVAEADSNTVGILFGNGDGTFQPEVELQIPNAEPLGIAIADVNGDGHPDLIVAISGSGPATNLDFAVLLGDGAGHFGPAIYGPPLISDGIDEGFAISVGDMNGDGIPDLLVTGEDAFSTTVKTYFGKGDGSFTAGKMVWGGNSGVGTQVSGAVLADLNGDGCPDVTVAMTLGLVDIFYNDCHGNFPSAPTLTYGMGDGTGGLAVADVNGDGHPDIITGGVPIQFTVGSGSDVGDTMTVRLNDGAGHFGPARVYRGDPGMVALVVTDLKGDGHPDVVTANQNANSTTVFANDGAGGFGEPMGGYNGFLEGVATSPLNAPLTPDLVADVDGDGKSDLALMEREELGSFNNMVTLAVMLNQGNGHFSLPIRTPLVTGGATVWDFILADFRHTGLPDFVALTSNGSESQLIYATNLGNGQFGPPVSLPFPSSDSDDVFGTLAVGDFNHDGKLDLAVATPVNMGTSDKLLVYLGNGDGTFEAAPFQLAFGNGDFPEAVFVGDANGDGKQDIFVWLARNGAVGTGLYEFLGNGDGTFQAPKEVFSTLSQMTMADLNHDGLLDIVDFESEASNSALSGTPPTIYIYLGQSNGGFSQPLTYTPYAGTLAEEAFAGSPDGVGGLFAPYLGDFDGDGNLDLAIFQQNAVPGGPSYVQFMKGNGDGTFTPTYDVFNLGIPNIPDLTASNLLGDGRSAFVQTPGFTSSYQVLPSMNAPFLQAEMAATPVLGGQDTLEISLNVPSSSDTTVALSASDPNVQIPVSATVPAGQLSVQVPFTLAGAFPANHWFSITAQAGGSTAIAYDFPQSAGLGSPFLLTLSGGYAPHSIGNFSTPAPGQVSDWSANISSTGVGTGTFQISCSGLPAGASCTSFSPQSFLVEPGAANGNTFTITTDPTIAPGEYPFTVTASDGFASVMTAAVLEIGDFSISISPPSLSPPPSGTATFTLASADVFGYTQSITLGCSGLPNGATCALQGQAIQSSSQPFVVNLASVPPGPHTFTVTGTSNSLTHSAMAQINVPAEPLASLNESPVSFGALLVGATGTAPGIMLTNSGNATLNITSIVAAANPGANGIFAQTNTCGASLAPGLSCAINLTFTPSAVGSSAGTLTLTDNASNSPQVISLSGSADDFAFQPAPGGSSSATVTAGQTAVYNLQIQGNQVQGSIVMVCSGAPPQGSCSLAQSILVLGATAAPFQVQVPTSANSNMPPTRMKIHVNWQREILLTIFAVILFYASAFISTKRRPLRYALGILVILGTVAAIASCGGGGGGGGGGNSGTPPGTYTITVTGQYGGGIRTMNLSLTVQ